VPLSSRTKMLAPRLDVTGRSVGADAFGWAIAACSSRAAMLKSSRVLCPIIDIGNHAYKGAANTEVRGTLGGAVELVATKPIQLGEQVTYCYGDLTNDDFLLDYGFLPSPPNPHDTAALAWAEGSLLSSACAAAGLDVDLTANWRRVALLSALPVGLASLLITRGALEERAMVACRIAAAPDAAALRKCHGGKKALPSAGNEAVALKIAAAMVAIALTGFPDPDAETAEPSADVGVALATQFMDEKRQLCASALASLGDRIKAIQSHEAKGSLRGLHKGKEAAGVRKKSARKGTERPKASGFGAAK